jgi:hypothetical protein
MFWTKYTDEQRKYALNLVSRVNFGHRGAYDGSKEDQYMGMLVETIFADEMQLPRPDGSKGFDNGYDFEMRGVKVDIKTMGRNSDPLMMSIANIPSSQLTENYQSELFVLASLNKQTRTLFFLGVLPKVEIKKEWEHLKGEVRTKGNGEKIMMRVDNYEIPYKEIRPVNNWLHLYSAIVNYKNYEKTQLVGSN